MLIMGPIDTRPQVVKAHTWAPLVALMNRQMEPKIYPEANCVADLA